MLAELALHQQIVLPWVGFAWRRNAEHKAEADRLLPEHQSKDLQIVSANQDLDGDDEDARQAWA